MMQVPNKKVIKKISYRSFRQNKTRNIIAVIAIALTTLMFSALFTIAISMNYSFEQQSFRQVGGYSHGGFKRLDKKQVEELKKDPLIKEYGISYPFSFPQEKPFQKSHVEMRYADDNYAKFAYSTPTTGTMPVKEKDLAADTYVLKLLGIKAKIGEQVTLDYPLGEKIVTETFTLCGFWEADPATSANMIWLSREYAVGKMAALTDEEKANQITDLGSWFLDVMFKDSKHIEENLAAIADNYGYNTQDSNADNYLDTGINWAYTSARVDNSSIYQTAGAILVVGLLILFTGYLIIYNVFQISVAGDVRFYGLLKTIGTTGRQIKRMIRYQALTLSLIAVPIGLLIGFFVGNGLTKIIMSTMASKDTYLTLNPWIFIGAAVFSLLTVIISCHKPGKMAASVSPIEAVRYTERSIGKKKEKKAGKGSKIVGMAVANLTRNRKKTILVITSLTLSIVLLNTTFAFTKGFNMDRFLEKFVLSDLIVGSADYFQSSYTDRDVSDTFIEGINDQEGIEAAGRVQLYNKIASMKVKQKEWMEYRKGLERKYIDQNILAMQPEDIMDEQIDIYGMDEMPWSYLKLVEGNIDWDTLNQSDGIIQVIGEDDYGKPKMEEKRYNIGDKMTIDYCNDFTYSEDNELIKNSVYQKEYEVVATVVVPNPMSTRRSGSSYFLLPSKRMQADADGNAGTMIYMVDTKKENSREVETYVKNFTEKIDTDMDYESKSSQSSQYASFQMMFSLVGSSLSLIIGIVGILNFINAELTSIMTRKRELAMLQSIGMTGKQVKKMLILEGVTYGIIAIIIAAVINLLIYGFIMKPIENIFWFYSRIFSMEMIGAALPLFLLMGIAIPLLVYQGVSKQSIVERLRESES